MPGGGGRPEARAKACKALRGGVVLMAPGYLQLVLQRRGAVELSHLYVPKFLESLQEIRLVQNAAVGGLWC